jgi:molybdenum cofactor cytidylyltransferase
MAGMDRTGGRSGQDFPPRLCALLLAAGAGRRFGGPKLLAPLRGRPLLLHALDLALGCAAVNAGLWVVTGAHREAVGSCLAGAPAALVHNPAWAQGMGGSIATGVAVLPADTNAVLLLLADQAALGMADIDRLCAAWLAHPGAPVAAAHRGGSGAPAIFPRAWWPRLMALEGDLGARDLLRREPGLRTVAMPNAGKDVDTAAQLARLAHPEG